MLPFRKLWTPTLKYLHVCHSPAKNPSVVRHGHFTPRLDSRSEELFDQLYIADTNETMRQRLSTIKEIRILSSHPFSLSWSVVIQPTAQTTQEDGQRQQRGRWRLLRGAAADVQGLLQAYGHQQGWRPWQKWSPWSFWCKPSFVPKTWFQTAALCFLNLLWATPPTHLVQSSENCFTTTLCLDQKCKLCSVCIEGVLESF